MNWSRFSIQTIFFLTVSLFGSRLAQAANCVPGDALCAQLPSAARDSWIRGRALQQRTPPDCRGAIAEFQRAYEVSANPLVLRNIAVCEKELSHYVRSVDTFERELKEGAGRISASEKAEIERFLQILKKYTTTLEIVANEVEATLFIDDQDFGKTPFLGPIRVDVGRHRLRLHKERFKDEIVESLDFTADRPSKWTFKLEPLVRTSPVTVTITGAPNAKIFLDGREIGDAGKTFEVTAEHHTFEARVPGNTHEPARQTVDVKFGEPMTIVLNLSASRHQGKAIITVEPFGALIEIDGKVVGQTRWEGNLPSGGHQLVIKKGGYDPQQQELVLGDDQVRTLNVTLLETRTQSWIWWTLGTVAVVGAGATVSYFVFKAKNEPAYDGTFATPGLVPGWFRR